MNATIREYHVVYDWELVAKFITRASADAFIINALEVTGKELDLVICDTRKEVKK